MSIETGVSIIALAAGLFTIAAVLSNRVDHNRQRICDIRLELALTQADSAAVYHEAVSWYERRCHRPEDRSFPHE